MNWLDPSQTVIPPSRGRRSRVLSYLVPTDFAHIDEHGGLPLRVNGSAHTTGDDRITRTIAERDETNNPSLHPALQDMADCITQDVHLACYALNDPDLDYPGVDDGIDPVPDDHVALVIWAMQRELDRELRHPRGGYGTPKRPAVPLGKLPWRIQRALAERRRLRFLQWGINKEVWESNQWQPDNVPEDPEWEPTWKR